LDLILTKVTMMYLALALTLTLVSPSLTLDCVDTLISTGKANTLVQLVAKADLASALRVGSITIFAPTDDAFASLPAAKLGEMLVSKQTNQEILTYHVLSSKAMSTDITDAMKVDSLQGASLRFNIYSENHVITVNGGNISQPDLLCDNGVIHFVDKVLVPPTKTVIQIVTEDPRLSTFLQLVTVSGIASKFQADPMTLFAPTDIAFAKVDKCYMEALTNVNGNKSYIQELLEYHGVPNTLFATGVYNREVVNSIDSAQDRMFIRVDEETGIRVNNAHVTTKDMLASNGVVHKIDNVLIPYQAMGFWLNEQCPPDAFGKK